MSNNNQSVGADKDKAPNENELGQRIRSRRKEKLLTLQQLADKLDVTRAYLSAIELGKSSLSQSNGTIKKIADELDFDNEELRAIRPSRKLNRRLKKKVFTELGDILTAARQKLNLSQGRAAKKLEMNRAQLSEYETGRVCPTYSTLKKIIKEFDCEIPDHLMLSVQKNNTPSAFGKFIVARRRELDLSQEQLAGKSELSRNTIARIEATDKFVWMSTIKKLEKVLGAIPLELLLPPMDHLPALAKFVITERIKLRLSQKEFAKSAAIHYYILSKIERGESCKRPYVLKRIAKALQCEIPENLL